jgi:hypothetical protein
MTIHPTTTADPTGTAFEKKDQRTFLLLFISPSQIDLNQFL